MPAVDDLLQKGWRDGVDEVRAKDAGRLEVDRIAVARLEIVVRRIAVVEVRPELRRVDARILDLRERDLVRVDVVDSEEARDAFAPRRRGNEAGHPVIAVDEVGLHVGDDVVDDLALKRKRQLEVAFAPRIDRVAVVEAAVLGQVDALVGQVALVLAQLFRDKLSRLDMEHAPVVRQRNMYVGAQLVQRLDERRGDIGHAAGLGGHLAGEIAHPLREIGNLRRDNENPRILWS